MMNFPKIVILGLLTLAPILSYADKIVQHEGYFEQIKNSDPDSLHYYLNSHEMEEIHISRMLADHQDSFEVKLKMTYTELENFTATALLFKTNKARGIDVKSFKENKKTILEVEIRRSADQYGASREDIKTILKAFKKLKLPMSLRRRISQSILGFNQEEMRKKIADLIESHQFVPFENTLDLLTLGETNLEFRNFKRQLDRLCREAMPGERHLALQMSAEMLEASCTPGQENYKACMDITIALHKLLAKNDKTGAKSYAWLANYALKLLSGGKEASEMVRRLSPEIAVSEQDFSPQERRRIMEAFFYNAQRAGEEYQNQIPIVASRIARCQDPSQLPEINFDDVTLLRFYQHLLNENTVNANLHQQVETAASCVASRMLTPVSCDPGKPMEYPNNIAGMVHILDSLGILAQERAQLQEKLNELARCQKKRNLTSENQPGRSFKSTKTEKTPI